MTRLNRRRDNYATVDGSRHRSKTKWFILVFIFMITITALASYLLYHYSSIKGAYESNIYQAPTSSENDLGPDVKDSKSTYTHLLLTLDNVYVDGNQLEEVVWAQVNYVKAEEAVIQSVNIPMNLNVESADSSETYQLDVYGESGIQGVKEAMEKLLQVQIDYVTQIRVNQIRDVIEPLGSINLDATRSVSLDNLQLNEGTTYKLTTLQSSQLVTEIATWDVFEQVDMHQSIYSGIISELTSLDNVIRLPNLLAHGEFVISSTMPFSKIVDIYLKDDYNLTDVDLNQLIELKLTQVDNQDIYTTNLDELRDLTRRMSTAIEEASMKE
ncbi:hypothetical protein ACF3NG_08060 [Aerococcaceae bacterium WGS1372]